MKAALMTEAGVIPGVAHLKRINPASESNYQAQVPLRPGLIFYSSGEAMERKGKCRYSTMAT